MVRQQKEDVEVGAEAVSEWNYGLNALRRG